MGLYKKVLEIKEEKIITNQKSKIDF